MRLSPMSDVEYAAFLEVLIPSYAADHVRTGNWSAEEAEAKSAAQIEQLLPEGAQTPDHYLYMLRVEGEPEPVGILWLAIHRSGEQVRAFIYDIEIHEAYRRRGYASQAIRAAEDKARELGSDTLALHVFGHNTAARALYDKLGFVVMNVQMAKTL